MADQFTTTAKVKTRVGITDGTDDALISDFIDQVTSFIQDETGRRLIAETLTNIVVDTSAGSRIEVPRGVRACSSLAVASSDQPDDGSGTYTAVAPADILIRPGPLQRRPGWPADYILIRGSAPRLSAAINGAKLTIDVDFLAVPPIIAAITLDAVVTAYNDRQAGASDVIGADGTSIIPWANYFGPGTPQRRTIDRYRLAARPGIA